MPNPKDTKSQQAAAVPVTGAGYSPPAAAQPPAVTPAIANAFAEFETIAATLSIGPDPDNFKASMRACAEPTWCLPEPNCTARLSLNPNQQDALNEHLKNCNPVVVQSGST